MISQRHFAIYHLFQTKGLELEKLRADVFQVNLAVILFSLVQF